MDGNSLASEWTERSKKEAGIRFPGNEQKEDLPSTRADYVP
jgi:hypothetical protein